MKKFFYSFGLLAASLLFFSSCQKDLKDNGELQSDKLVTISFTAEKAGLDTRTAAVEQDSKVSYKWTDEDAANIKLFTVGTETQGEGDQAHEVEVLTEVTNAVANKVSDTKLQISASVAPNATYIFRAILCDPESYTGSGTNYSTRKPKVKSTQYPNGYDNFDPTADILVSDNMEVHVIDSGEETVSTGNLEMVFRRQIVVNKMTLKNLTAGEKVRKVVVTSTTGNIQGYLNNGSMSGQSKVISLEYDDVVVPTGGQFPVYFISMNNTGIALSVEVTTDQYIYTKSFAEGRTIDFNLGQFTKFNVALPEGVANTALTLPLEDSMEWAMTGNSDETNELTVSDLIAKQGNKKIYASATKAYKGVDGLKLGTGSVTGSITTNSINLSSAFYIAIDAKNMEVMAETW